MLKSFAALWIFLLASGCSALAQTPGAAPKSFDECVAAGFAVTRSAPPSCSDGNGHTFRAQLPASIRAPACKSLCGDGECQEMVCMEINCPCAENHTTCPQDCKS